MTRRRGRVLAIVGAASAGATIVVACFPTYDFGAAGAGDDAGSRPTPLPDGGHDASDGGRDGVDGATLDGDAGPDVGADAGLDGAIADVTSPPFDAATMATIEAGSFRFGGSSGPVATLTHAFYIDSYEATVGRFKAFVSAGSPRPCDGGSCSLDPGGPYEAAMQWNPSWNAEVVKDGYATSCNVAQSTSVQDPTFNDGVAAYPIGCVTWFHAVAMCAFEGKRLPTETEWEYVASGRGQDRTYPWGDTAPVRCDQAIWFGGGPDDAGAHNGCHWPVPVGSTPNGGSRDGVFDLSGSVYEWVWDDVTPVGGTDPISPQAASPGQREDRGGSFGSDTSKLPSTVTDSTPPDGNYTDIGFRCARTLR